jgi:NAD-dependent deacetylase
MQLEQFSALIRSHRNIVFFTGAGISTESGVPDFRSRGVFGPNTNRFIFRISWPAKPRAFSIGG